MDKEIIKIENLVQEENKVKQKPKINFMKLLTGKNLKILILCVIFVVALILFLKLSGTNKTSSKTTSTSSIQYQTSLEYSKQLETKLESLLSQIKGAGNVRVMISLDGSPELVYAMDSNEKVSNNTSGSTTTSSSTPILVQTNGTTSPLILTEVLPKVKGVIVVSSGANDISIKLDILNSVSTLLDISTDKINVLKGI